MNLRLLAPLALLCLGIAASVSFAESTQAAAHFDAITRKAEKEFPSLLNLYHHFHRNPELSFHEEKTAARLADELKKLGFEVTQGIGGHGVVAVMTNGAGPTLLVRADMDALPVVEETGLDYASRVKTKDAEGNEVGVMHACGHDIHITSLVGTARVLTSMKEAWKGTLVMIAQPAEERGAGARAMLADGLYTRFPRPDYAIALHVDAGIAAGQIGYVSGFAMANVDSVDITIRGRGGHGAYPDQTKDPIVIAAQVVLALQTIVSREISPIEPAVVTVGSIHGGTKHNIIPDDVHLQLTIRSYKDEVREQIMEAIRRITKGISVAAGVPEELAPLVKIQDEYTPAAYNDPKLTERVVGVLSQLLGEGNLLPREPVMGGEDFGRYGREEPRVPIFMFRLGSVPAERARASQTEGKPLPSLHSSLYYPDPEPTIKTGVRAMSAAAIDLLQPK